MTIRQRLAAFAMFGAIAWVINLLTLAELARALGQDSFGLLTFGLSLASLTTTLVGPGLNLWGVRAVARDPAQAARYILIVNGTQFILGLAAYALLASVATYFFEPAERTVALASGVLLFTTAAGIQWLCQGLERYDLIGCFQFMTSAATYAGVLTWVQAPEHVARGPLVMAGAQLVSTGMVLVVLVSRTRLGTWRVGSVETVSALRQAIPLGVSTVFILVLHHANTIILQLHRGASEVGLFSTGFRLVELITIAPTVLASVFLPRISRLHAREPGQTNEEMRRFVQISIGAACLPAAVLLAEPLEVTRAVYGSDFAFASGVVQTMSVAVLFNFAAITYLMGAVAMGEDRAFLTSIIVGLTVSVGGGLLAVPLAGYRGATLVFASVDVAIWLALLPTYFRLFRSVFLREWRLPLVAAGAFLTWTATSSTVGVDFWPRLLVGCLIYVLIVAPSYVRLLRTMSAPVAD